MDSDNQNENQDRQNRFYLFDQPLHVIGVGLEGFADELRQQNVKVTQLDWRPPAEGDAELADLVSKLGG